jgi:hypothetical protein
MFCEVGLQRLGIAAPPALGEIAPADVRDPPVSEGEQVLHGLPGSAVRVGRDAVGDRRVEPHPDQHDRRTLPRGGDQVVVDRGRFRRGHDEPVDLVASQAGKCLDGAFLVLVGGRGDDAEAELGGGHEADQAGLLGGETSAPSVRPTANTQSSRAGVVKVRDRSRTARQRRLMCQSELDKRRWVLGVIQFRSRQFHEVVKRVA